MAALNISIVGLEGSSKTTSIKTIVDVFNKHGLDINTTKEPGGSPTANRIRHLILNDAGDDDLTPQAELLLFFASRMQTRNSVVKKKLDSGVSILSDRCWWCSYAYQAYNVFSDSEMRTFKFLKDQWEEGGYKYDAVLFMDVDPEVGLIRAKGRGELDRIEKKTMDFFERAREGYLYLASTESGVTTIDANGTQDEVQTLVEGWAESLVEMYKHKKTNYRKS